MNNCDQENMKKITTVH